MEGRELLNKYKFNGDTAKVIRGAALPALNGEEKWGEDDPGAAGTLWTRRSRSRARGGQAVPDGGRGRVLDQGPRDGGDGRVERGKIKVNEEVDIIGFVAT
jgi:elongation factor Tu